jgi:hypothetical protein
MVRSHEGFRANDTTRNLSETTRRELMQNHANASTNGKINTSANNSAPTSEPSDPRRRERVAKSSPMVHDPALGPRRADVTHWRCRRVDSGDDQKGKLLLWDDGGVVKTSEWPIQTCTPEAILERWGAGQYIVQYIKVDAGVRKPWGRSRMLSIAPPARESRPVSDEAKPSPQAPLVPTPTDPGFSNIFSLLAYLDERSEKARSSAAAEARYAIERAAAEAKLAQERHAAESKIAAERYRADAELQMERERLASKERIAQIEAQARATPARGERIDQEALAQRITTLVDERVRDALDDREDDEAPDSAPAAGAQKQQTVTQILEALLPLAHMLAAKLAPPAPVLPNAPSPTEPRGGGEGNGGKGNDPNGG